MEKVAIIQPTHLGDLLCSVPLYRALRRAWPEAEIILAGNEAAQPFFHRFRTYLDRLLVVPDVQDDWTAEQTGFLTDTLRQESLDLVIALDFHPSASFWDGQTADGGPEPSVAAVTFEADDQLRAEAERLLACLARQVGARCAAGLADRGIGLAPSFAIPITYSWPVPAMLLQLTGALGVPSDDISLEFPLTGADRAKAAAVLADARLAGPGPLVGLHPGSAHPGDRWSYERFAAVGDLLAEKYQARILVTGIEQERPLAAAVISAMSNTDRVVNACGQTDLGCFAAVVDQMDLFVGNDTGAAHIARALARPAVVICIHQLVAAQWFDWGEQRHRSVIPPGGGETQHCRVSALLAVSVDAVVTAAEDMLASWRHDEGRR